MPLNPASYAVNTYSYMQHQNVRDCLLHLASQGYSDFEIMLFPGHLWPAELSKQSRSDLANFLAAEKFRVTTLNMPNVDINVAGATAEMRNYSLKVLSAGIELAGDLGADSVLIGPGKANPMSSLPKEKLHEYFFAALNSLSPLARRVGTTLSLENLPIAFLPDSEGLMEALDRYGDPDIGVIFDVANSVFCREDPVLGLRRVRSRLRFVHVSDTPLEAYRHDAVGNGVVPFAAIAKELATMNLAEPTILEIITSQPDRDLRESVQKLEALEWKSGRAQY